MALLSYLGLLVYAVALLIWGYSENTVVLANGAAVFFLAMFVMDLGRGAMRILLPREFALLLVFAVQGAASVCLQAPSDPSRYLTTMLVFGLAFMVANTVANVRSVVVIEVSYYVGASASIVADMVASAYEVSGDRAVGLYEQSNTLAQVLVVASCFLGRRLLILVRKPAPLPADMLAAASVCLGWAMVLLHLIQQSGSRRGALLGILVGAATLLNIALGRQTRRGVRILAVCVSPIIVAQLVSVFTSAAFYSRFQNIERWLGDRALVQEASLTIRAEMVSVGMDLWAKEPLFGHGFDGFRTVGGFGTYSHNNYVELLANGGILGFAFYYGVMVSLFCRIIGGIRRAWDLDVVWGLVVLLIVVVGDVASVTYYDKITWLLLGSLLGIFARDSKGGVRGH